jgi:uncharacterized protein Yka (UPF0111/DUF47 family)
MNRHHWFLPDEPDVLGLLDAQIAQALGGLDALIAWAGGNPTAAARVREAEHEGDVAKEAVMRAASEAFVTPIEPEDLFALAQGIDWLLSRGRDLVNEATAMGVAPDERMEAMVTLLRDSLREIGEALASLPGDPDRATTAANAAIKIERSLEQSYYDGMAALLDNTDQRDRIARRELYRNIARIGDAEVLVAERVIYSVMKGR